MHSSFPFDSMYGKCVHHYHDIGIAVQISVLYIFLRRNICEVHFCNNFKITMIFITKFDCHQNKVFIIRGHVILNKCRQSLRREGSMICDKTPYLTDKIDKIFFSDWSALGVDKSSSSSSKSDSCDGVVKTSLVSRSICRPFFARRWERRNSSTSVAFTVYALKIEKEYKRFYKCYCSNQNGFENKPQL